MKICSVCEKPIGKWESYGISANSTNYHLKCMEDKTRAEKRIAGFGLTFGELCKDCGGIGKHFEDCRVDRVRKILELPPCPDCKARLVHVQPCVQPSGPTRAIARDKDGNPIPLLEKKVSRVVRILRGGLDILSGGTGHDAGATQQV